jgi:diguanylate cyclase (GGDEF)-like protein
MAKHDSLTEAVEDVYTTSEIDLTESTVKYHSDLMDSYFSNMDKLGHARSSRIIRFANEAGATQRRNLEKLATKDPLTGLLNRKGFEDKIGPIYSANKRGHNPMSVLLIDGDKFKEVNDTYGHKTGDDVLKYLSKAFTDATRASDVISRYGGEEFVAFLSDTSLEGAKKVASKINNIIYEANILPDGKKFSVSIGIAEVDYNFEYFDRGSVDVIGMAIDKADKALYYMKDEAGRNGAAYSIGKGQFRKV